ncbi:DUF3375 domain-containing protein [cf. Phormidesmis sp. LEGE 11477]|uniref:DUF3375 domain-containing protein n=1 Tax=cf. Phormidesmis sp. LEGE 11477 TaxID=1828680 RepID=UPI00187EB7A0|nr:DUF3375 domain-containing protein [cf. Phormidesmis sp. LEGE 11477]MBE9064827.1 DUF3375 domain-containing protein [cf. Phormidesmis sp. LEGE 11477]
MDYEQIKYELENSATLKLMRSRNIALIASFLYKQFKVAQRVSIPQIELEEKLADYSTYLQGIYSELSLQPPKAYLNEWINAQLLRKTFARSGESDEPVFSLTPEAEKALAWLEDLQQRDEFIGTESRFLQILSLLKEIKEGSTADVETRVAQLESDRDRIQQEIDTIRATGAVDPFNETQLRERFMSANSLTRQLMSDFRAVEQKFRELTRKVQADQLEADSRRGTVVGKVLDADDALKESDQGRSFYTFFNFLMSESKQRELKESITAIYELDELRSLTRNYGFLRRIIRNLLDSADHIVQSNQRLTEKLRQMLDERNLRENRRVADLIVDVQRLSRQIAPQAINESAFWRLNGAPKINLMMERPLHPLEDTEAPTFADLDFSDLLDHELEAELDELAQQFYVDEALLAQRIDRALEDRDNIALSELLEWYPVTQGLPEVVAYLSLATKAERHSVEFSTIDLMKIEGLAPDSWLQLKLPKVVFYR